MSHGIIFKRRVNPQILKRIQGLYSAGLWNWWTKIMVNFMPRIQGGYLKDGIQPVKASDMDGNITIVFVIFCVGILTGILVWIFEVNLLVKMASAFIKFGCMCFNKVYKFKDK